MGSRCPLRVGSCPREATRRVLQRDLTESPVTKTGVSHMHHKRACMCVRRATQQTPHRLRTRMCIRTSHPRGFTHTPPLPPSLPPSLPQHTPHTTHHTSHITHHTSHITPHPTPPHPTHTPPPPPTCFKCHSATRQKQARKPRTCACAGEGRFFTFTLLVVPASLC